MIELRRLRLFTAVAQEGSFTAAGRRLHLSQSAVSQQMSIFEREIGLTLVERTRRGTQLTPAGHLLAQRARHLFNEISTIEQEMAQLGGGSDVAPHRVRARQPHPAAADDLVV